ncbi:MAG: hypothetical protein IJZ73_04810, partial [Clostridia bacterium]|nr:hypothetical protein [Clostridia bacterium]
LLMMVNENPSVRPPLTLPTLTDKGIVVLAEIYSIVSANVKMAPFGVLFELLMMVDENPSVRPPLTLPTLTDKGIVALAEIYPIVSAKIH